MVATINFSQLFLLNDTYAIRNLPGCIYCHKMLLTSNNRKMQIIADAEENKELKQGFSVISIS